MNVKYYRPFHGSYFPCTRNVTQYVYSVAYFYVKINDFKQHLNQMVYFDKRINLFIFSGEEA